MDKTAEDVCYNAIAIPLQGAFEEVAKFAVDSDSAAVLLACASIVYQEALVIAARLYAGGNNELTLKTLNNYLRRTLDICAQDAVTAIVLNMPLPTHATPRPV